MEAYAKSNDDISIKNVNQEKSVEACVDVFIQKYKTLIQRVVRSYEGEYITQIFFKAREKRQFNHYMDIQNEYDENYYMNDCGGYEQFKKTKGKKLDGRLLAMMNLAAPNGQDVILDIGCGRGELAYAFSKYAKKVVGIDYSKDAIKIAEQTFGCSLNVRSGKLKYISEDILALDSSEKYTKIVMADVYEHIESEVIEKILKKIKALLTENGILFIHTAPNKDYYEKVYPEQVKAAYKRGEFLPANPRSRYEDRMHINEQSPSKLKSTLQKYFSDVYVWTGSVGTQDDLIDLKKQKISIDITAIAGARLDQEAAFRMVCYGRLNISQIKIRLSAANSYIKGSGKTELRIPVKVKNQGKNH